MSSSIRNMQRRALRQRPDYEPRTQPVVEKDGLIRMLHFTKGWRVTSMARLLAGRAMAVLLDNVAPPRKAKPPKRYREVVERRARGLMSKNRFPQQDSRQQRRYRERKGLPNPYL